VHAKHGRFVFSSRSLARLTPCSRARAAVALRGGNGGGAACQGDAAYDLARGGAAALLDELQERALWARHGL
jgi:hypothetical protein